MDSIWTVKLQADRSDWLHFNPAHTLFELGLNWVRPRQASPVSITEDKSYAKNTFCQCSTVCFSSFTWHNTSILKLILWKCVTILCTSSGNLWNYTFMSNCLKELRHRFHYTKRIKNWKSVPCSGCHCPLGVWILHKANARHFYVIYMDPRL